MPVFTSKRLKFRQFKPQDSTQLMSIFGDKDVMHYGDGIQTIEWVKTWISKQQHSYQKFNYGNWAVIQNETSELIGYCGLTYENDVCGKPETTIGYRFAQHYWGKGYATEAVLATLDYSFNTLDLKRIVATIDPHNIASIKVAQKTGMTYEQDVMYEGYTHADHVYVLESNRLESNTLS